MKLKKILSCILAAALAASMLAACGKNGASSVPGSEAAQPALTYFSMNLCDENGAVTSVSMYQNVEAGISVEYNTADGLKMGAVSAEALSELQQLWATLDLDRFIGLDTYKDGSVASAALYAEFDDSSAKSMNSTGEIPEGYAEAFAGVCEKFDTLTQDFDYADLGGAPAPAVEADPESSLLLQGIYDACDGLMMPDLVTADMTTDPYSFYYTGLQDYTTGIDAITVSYSEMNTVPYSLVVFRLNESADVAELEGLVLENIDWRKWLCVTPTKAMVCSYENYVIYLLADDAAFDIVNAGIETLGVENVMTAQNPDLQ